MDGYPELKPCPFCGGQPEIVKEEFNHGMDGYSRDWRIRCSDCGARIYYPADEFYGRKYDPTPRSVIEKWNRRTHERTRGEL